ncbi:MAG: hypothetical protein V3U84_02250 [Thiotrichaceae bacterium]
MSNEEESAVCGIVMPISAIEDCSENHWLEVLQIFTDAIECAGFKGNLVSNADDVGIIHKRIIQNLYDNPVLVCDVSCINPNVMFELGLRLAFDKPTIIVKDDKTTYSFDTSPIEHIEYPRDLRFNQIVDFKEKLSEKILATYKKSRDDSNYTTFLGHFGEFKVAKIDQTEVSGQEFILESLESLRLSVNRLSIMKLMNRADGCNIRSDIEICMRRVNNKSTNEYLRILQAHTALSNVCTSKIELDHFHLTADVKPEYSTEMIRVEIETIVGKKALMMCGV